MATRKTRKPLKQSEIIEKLAETTGLSKTQVKQFLDELASLAHREVVKSGEFVLPGLGSLASRQRKARQGRNPATGAEIKIPARKVVKFKVGKSLKTAVAGDNTSDSDI